MNLSFNEALDIISHRITEYKKSSPLVIAVDGRAASGKTTFADQLSKKVLAQVIHTDDFFRPRDESGNLNISEFDGNFDTERFKNEVVKGILSQKPFDYGIFNCQKGKIVKTVHCIPSKCFIVEGAYSLNPNLCDYANIKIFFDIAPELQKERIVKRDGADAYENFAKIWIPAEERYISHYSVESICDYCINA